jgi:hypothetical protein
MHLVGFLLIIEAMQCIAADEAQLKHVDALTHWSHNEQFSTYHIYNKTFVTVSWSMNTYNSMTL